MKAKINVTVFQNGDVDILQASVYEELWKDYKAFKERARRHHEKDSAKGDFFARRYERAALLTLFTFLEGVVDRWLKEAAAAAGAEPVGLPKLSDKCRYLTQLACLPPFRGITYDAARLLTFTGRYEQADLALLEHVDGSLLQTIEDAVDEYMTFIERVTGFTRFPHLNAGTAAIMETIGSWRQ
ncbi:hypothetical protein [Megasphaera stantonii]|uniref:Uncharacterized protein n=1 Tax=Megasphaera stantonii TaxID=2144175 RepID=A0A346B2E5_9FIRM|nr:hypothetical protein [Megasphaera stantonii]AXL22288.1 hypothetical protein DKB62_12350 [Megasphaera stantonii]